VFLKGLIPYEEVFGTQKKMDAGKVKKRGKGKKS
jgi:hypothetical protein